MLKYINSIKKFITQKPKNPDKDLFNAMIILNCILIMMIIMDTNYFSVNDSEQVKNKMNRSMFLFGITGIIKIFTDFTFKFKVLIKSFFLVIRRNEQLSYVDKTNFMWLLMDLPLLIIIIFHNSWSNGIIGLQISGVVGVLIFNIIKNIINNNKNIEDRRLSRQWRRKK